MEGLTNSYVEYRLFNPVVEDWTPECQEQEIKERETCALVLYTITPKMTGVYSVAEVVDDSNKRPEKTILVLLFEDGKVFLKAQEKSLRAVGDMVKRNGGHVFYSLEEVAKYVNLIK